MITKRLRRAALLTMLPAALMLNMSGASAATLSPLAVASGASPFSACTMGSAPGAVNYPNAEVEPWVAVNPANSNNIIGVWQQDRWSDGAARGLVAGYSTNGGTTWNEVAQPFSACAEGGPSRYDRASDPWVSIGPDGTAYSVSISFQGVGTTMPFSPQPPATEDQHGLRRRPWSKTSVLHSSSTTRSPSLLTP